MTVQEAKCQQCNKKCPQEKLASDIAKGRMYATNELIQCQKELEQYRTMKLEKYYVIRAIKSSKGKKECIAEKECLTEPTPQEIGSFCYEQGATFCSVVENYRLREFTFDDVNAKKPITNADRIRNMTDEELADMLFESCIKKMGFEECKYSDGGINACKKCVLEWLQAEVKEGESNADT